MWGRVHNVILKVRWPTNFWSAEANFFGLSGGSGVIMGQSPTAENFENEVFNTDWLKMHFLKCLLVPKDKKFKV